MPYSFAAWGSRQAHSPWVHERYARGATAEGLQALLGHLLSVHGEDRFTHLDAAREMRRSQFVRGSSTESGLGIHFGGGRSRSSFYNGDELENSSERSPAKEPPSSNTRRTTWPVSTNLRREPLAGLCGGRPQSGRNSTSALPLSLRRGLPPTGFGLLGFRSTLCRGKEGSAADFEANGGGSGVGPIEPVHPLNRRRGPNGYSRR